jgi:hypothetical protein
MSLLYGICYALRVLYRVFTKIILDYMKKQMVNQGDFCGNLRPASDNP